MIILDASVLIAHLNRDDACHQRAERMLLEAADYPFGASSLTLAETLVGPARAGKIELARAAVAALEIAEIPAPAGSAERLAGLRASTGLKLPDCCVLLAAETSQAIAVLTFDERLDRRAQESGYGWEPRKSQV